MITDFLFIFTIIFGYKIGILDFSVIFPFVILFFTILLKNIRIKSVPKIIFNFFFIFSVILIISIFSYLINVGDFDLEYILKPMRSFILIYIIYLYLTIRKINMIYLSKLIVFSILVHSVVIYLQYILYYYDIDRTFLYHPKFTEASPLRKVGLATGFPTAGIMLVSSCLISFYLSFYYKSKLYFLLSLIMGLSIFLTARSAMYLYIILVPLYLIYLSSIHKNYTPIKWYLSFIFITITIISFYLLPVLQGTIDKMFVNYINYTQTGSFHDNSTKHLVSGDHLFYPKSAKTFIIGNSLSKLSGYQPSDISYVRLLMSKGIISLILYLVAYIYLFYNSFIHAKLFNDKSLTVLLYFLYIGFFAMTFKGPYLFSRLIGDIILIISLGCIFTDKEYFSNQTIKL